MRVSHDEGTTYGVDCQYHYRFRGRDYTGDTPSFYSSSDNIGSFQENFHDRLKVAKQSGVVNVWVDPDQPENSVLDRTLRSGFLTFELIFVLAFGSIGLAILTGMLASREPKVIDGSLRIDSSYRVTRLTMRLLGLYYAMIVIVVVPTAIVCLLGGQWAALGTLLMASLTSCGLVVAWRRHRKHSVIGRLALPTFVAPGTEQARIELPPSWQGQVEMEARWIVPRPPSNQIGLEDEAGDAISFALPAVSGTTRVTEIPISIPELPDQLPSDSSLKLEVIGTIGGYRYQDEFEVSGDRLKEWLSVGEK